MAVTVTTNNFSSINTCEADTDWTGSSPNDNSYFYKEGTQCIGFIMKASGNNDSYVAGSWDLSGTKHLRCWFMTTALKELNTDASGGIQFSVYDGTNTGYYYVGGSTTYPGGWVNLVVDLSRNVDSGTKPTMSAITQIGIRVNLTTTAKNAENVWVDFLNYNDGLIAYGDDGGGDFDLDDIYAVDNDETNGGWGIIRKISGVFYLTGSLTIGDNSGTNGCKFADSSEIVIFEDRKVNASLYAFNIVGNSTGTTTVTLGAVSGGRGIQGCTFKAVGTPKFSIDVDDANVGTMKLYGCNFIEASTTSLPATSANKEVVSCSFEACGIVTVSTCTVTYCNFVNADTDAITVSSTSFAVTYCNFINPTNHGVELTAAGSYTFTGMIFSGTDGVSSYDVENTTAGSITVTNAAGTGSNTAYYENTGGGSTSIVSSYTVTVNVEDEDGNDIEHAQVYIHKSSPTNYTADTGNNAGDADLVVNEVVDTDLPQSSWVIVWDKSANEIMPYRYASWTSKTFTFNTEVTGTAAAGGSSTTLKRKTGTGFTSADIEEGDTIRNTTDGSWAVVDEIVGDDEITTTTLQGGSDNTWSEDDAYSLHKLAVTLVDNDDVVIAPLMNKQTNSSGVATFSFTGSVPVAIDVRIRYNHGGTKYIPYSTTGSISTSGYTLTAVLTEDEVAT